MRKYNTSMWKVKDENGQTIGFFSNYSFAINVMENSSWHCEFDDNVEKVSLTVRDDPQ